ncbi:unnamed protein product [Cuscuta europaea]|uniref:Uncharacterized protein n=1 Tax=Cuscuta europaea TaxID=41803 RepID=A0A9P0ZTL6_CUSEU|nr:unnamed protein product [Cuscuta europaea]
MERQHTKNLLFNQNQSDDWIIKDIWDELTVTQSEDDQSSTSDEGSSSESKKEALICLFGMHQTDSSFHNHPMARLNENDNDEVLSCSSSSSYDSSNSSVDMEALLHQLENFHKDHLLLMNENCRLQENLIIAQAQMG